MSKIRDYMEENLAVSRISLEDQETLASHIEYLDANGSTLTQTQMGGIAYGMAASGISSENIIRHLDTFIHRGYKNSVKS